MPGSRSMTASAMRTMIRGKCAYPRRWHVSAATCLPQPMASILQMPDSCLATNPGCGLTRARMNTASAAAAWRSKCTSSTLPTPESQRPTATASMSERIAQPALSSVTPRSASSATWPSAVAPPWLPMAGKMNGRIPRAANQPITAATMSGRWVMPREPTPTATVALR